MSLETTKTLLGVDNARVATIYNQVEGRVLRRLQIDLPDVVAIPPELEFVVQEATIVRYNRIGSEGMTSESMDGHSASYSEGDVLEPFEPHIADYIRAELGAGPTEGKVRFL